MENFSDNIKKVLLAGIGAVAVTGEKSKELLDEMVKKGELTVEQGKALNEELKHNIKKDDERKGECIRKGIVAGRTGHSAGEMTPEQLRLLKERILAKEEGGSQEGKEDNKEEHAEE